MKKSIVVIAYYFPPITGAGVQRSLRLVKELCRNDYNVTVFSSNSTFVGVDNEMEKEIPDTCVVLRFNDPLRMLYSSSKFMKLVRYVLYSLMIPDMMLFWYLKNKRHILQRIKMISPDCVITTSGPESSHLIGLDIKKRFTTIKWISDFRDAYAKNPSRMLSRNFLRNNFICNLMHRRVEGIIIKTSDYVTTVSQPLLTLLNASLDKGRVIPNGFDTSVFNKIKSEQKYPDYTLFYMGSLYFERNSDIFVKPLIRFLNELNPEERRNVRFVVAGRSRQKEMNELKARLVSYEVLRDLGFVNHTEAITIGSKSSLLLLLIDDVPGADTIYTGKVFEYIRMPTPILAIAPLKGAAGLLISNTKTGKVIQPGQDEEIYNFLIADYQKWKNDPDRYELLKEKDWNEINKYNEDNIFKLWQTLIDE